VVVRQFQSDYVEATAPLHWRQISEYSGFNTLVLGILAEVVGRWFGYATEIFAFDATFTHERPLDDGSGVRSVDRPDSVFIVARMESGATATFTLSAVVGAPSGNVIEGYGLRGSLRYLVDEDRLLQATAPGWAEEEVQISTREEGGWRVEEEFIDAIRQGRSGNPSWDEALRYMQFVEAVEESARTGRSVALSSV
jgi:predicted dehydrogenase